uniref:protein-tyrosine-phosphatase n=1 Tax=Paramoeba aestuarina TaxID=180227 RepID=A0A7S4KTU3_9EUKA|eukprot:CAMPEP_0201522954 /NCGR_PEP_ID=MMETSP0161_2-20130828/18657_1 /ASSEMBLY_ACC=CAM_ASM_000251 /TAXON_ID=180227 /ORGANISM="Neoparamoeba aestuarina, Strain SoJaBio B1-5/56/2" /LENGTH=230 /DNA_ID=CAMNT_0047921933 /DNA_START=31 /DNA_END=723 /DNA_ORIENTATION=-
MAAEPTDQDEIFTDASELSENDLFKLSLELTKLPKEELDSIRKIIGVAPTEDIDISSLDPKTLNRIRMYMRHSVIRWKNLQFVVMDTPKNKSMNAYVQICKHYNVTTVCCLTRPEYSKQKFEENGIDLHVLEFQDGSSPPSVVVKQWLKLVKAEFGSKTTNEEPTSAIGVHCAAGLGRAPVLVAVALVEYGLDALKAVELIREKRRGAINQRQLHYLRKYEPDDNSCTIS